MLLLSSILLLVVFPAGILAVGILTRGYSYYTTLVSGASFGLALSCMMFFLCWHLEVPCEDPETIASECSWGYRIYQAVGTPALAAVSALAARIGAEIFVKQECGSVHA